MTFLFAFLILAGAGPASTAPLSDGPPVGFVTHFHMGHFEELGVV